MVAREFRLATTANLFDFNCVCSISYDGYPMDRRDFLKTTGTALAATVLPASTVFAADRIAAGRVVLPLNKGWRYHPAKVAGAEAPGFDDSAFEQVVVPHTNISLPWHSFDDKDYEFVSTYRRRFKTPAAVTGKRVFVDFEGVMTASTVWINGVSLGEYRGGYTPFSFELTQHLAKEGGENVLVVQVDSTERADIPPFGYQIDYLTFGGLYREVSLRMVPEIYLDNIFAHAEGRAERKAFAGCGLLSCWKDGCAGALSLEVEVFDDHGTLAKANGAVVLRKGGDPDAAADPVTTAPVYASTESVRDPARQTVTLKQIEGVKLWDLKNPQLYTVRVRLMHGGQTIDEETRRIGISRGDFYRSWLFAEWTDRQTARAGSAPDVSVCGAGDAGAGAAAGREDSAAATPLQYCPDVALSAVATLFGLLRRDRIAGAGGDSGLAAYWRRGLAAAGDRQCGADGTA